MTRNEQHDDSQLEFNWTYLQRKAWINEAVLTPRKAKDGETVMPDKQRNLLHKLNEHYGKNNCAWPSINLLADEMDCHRQTVIRTIQVLVDRQILSVENDESRKGRNNLYRIIWSELQILEPTRRAQWLQMLFGKEKPHVESHVAHVESHVAHVESHLAHVESHVARPELLKNKPTNKSKNQPLPVNDDRPAHGGDPWQVVVVSLDELGMGDAERAASRARERGMTPDEVFDWIKRFVQLTAANPSIHAGYLHKWLFGRGKPPWIEKAKSVARKPSHSQMSNRDRMYFREQTIIRLGRKAGKSESEIQAEIAQAMQASGFVEAALGRYT